MIEPGFPTLLAHPALSYALAVLAIGMAAWLLVRGGRARGTAWWARLMLLSEVLLALGLIGLVLFGGRLALASHAVLLAERQALAQTAVDERLRDVAKAQCARAAPAKRGAVPTSANLTPFNPGVAANELCALARARPAVGAGLLEWQMAAHALRDFGARYPGCVENVFSRNNDCESTVGSAKQLALAIDRLAEAMQASRMDGATLLAVHGVDNGDGGWGFALLAACCAAAGMALRIARAVRDALVSAAS